MLVCRTWEEFYRLFERELAGDFNEFTVWFNRFSEMRAGDCGGIKNLQLPASTVYDDNEFEKVVILIETYFREGGIHLQLNHVSRETLIDAMKNPSTVIFDSGG